MAYAELGYPSYAPNWLHGSQMTYDDDMFPTQQQPRSYGRHQQDHLNHYDTTNSYTQYNHAPQNVFPDEPRHISNYQRRPSDQDEQLSYSGSSSPISQHSSNLLASPPSRQTLPKEVDERSYCQHPDCRDEHGQPFKSFSRKADVARHIRSAHERRFLDCPYKRCIRKGDHGFTRQDHLVEHQRQFHMEPIPKKGGRRESSGSGSGKGRHSA